MGWNASKIALCILSNFWQLQDLDKAVWENLRKGLDYSEKSPEPLQSEIPDSSGDFDFSTLMEIFRIAGALVLVLILIYIIVKIISGKRVIPPGDPATSIAQENFIESEIPVDILWQAWEEAKAAGQYRESLRLLYQIALKKLSEADKIQLHPEKTNWEYVTEISDPRISKKFADITIIYEMNWYGNSTPSESDFQIQHVPFLHFIETIPNEN